MILHMLPAPPMVSDERQTKEGFQGHAPAAEHAVLSWSLSRLGCSVVTPSTSMIPSRKMGRERLKLACFSQIVHSAQERGAVPRRPYHLTLTPCWQ